MSFFYKYFNGETESLKSEWSTFLLNTVNMVAISLVSLVHDNEQLPGNK